MKYNMNHAIFVLLFWNAYVIKGLANHQIWKVRHASDFSKLPSLPNTEVIDPDITPKAK